MGMYVETLTMEVAGNGTVMTGVKLCLEAATREPLTDCQEAKTISWITESGGTIVELEELT
jgi:hypothetical protein